MATIAASVACDACAADAPTKESLRTITLARPTLQRVAELRALYGTAARYGTAAAAPMGESSPPSPSSATTLFHVEEGGHSASLDALPLPMTTLPLPMPEGEDVVRIDRLSAEQEQALVEARRLYEAAGGVLDELWRPFLIRFLVFFRWRPQKASKMLKATAEWRAASGANRIRAGMLEGTGPQFTNFPHARTHLELLWITPLHGFTMQGDILSFWQVGSIVDLMGRWYDEVTDAEFAEFNLHVLEMYATAADRESVRRGYLVRSSVVFDTLGAHLKQISTRLIRRLSPILPLPDLYYPELVGTTFVLNAPWAVYTLWGMIKIFLSKEMQAKVVILSPKDTQTTFLKHVRPADVPRFVTASAECALMPASVAVATGFAGLSAEELDALLINRTAPGYRVPRYTAAGELA